MDDKAFGNVKIRLEEAIQASGMSKNYVMNRAYMQRTQLNTYCRGDIQRVDLAILSRLCYALDCSISDILEYVPPVIYIPSRK